MPTTTRFDLGGEGLPRINLGGAGKRILQLAILVLVIILLMASTTSIPTGNVGVLTLFGRVTGETLPEGIHLMNPLKSVQKLSVQTQSLKESANVPSNEGLILALDTSLLFRLDKTMAAQVYQTVGADYVEKIVEPTLRAAIRASTSAHTANAWRLFWLRRPIGSSPSHPAAPEPPHGSPGRCSGRHGCRAAPAPCWLAP